MRRLRICCSACQLGGLEIEESILAEQPCSEDPYYEGCVTYKTQVRIHDGAGHQSQWSHLSQGQSGVVSAWTLPNQDLLVLYRHQGLFYEGGYDVDLVVVLTDPKPATAATKPAQAQPSAPTD
jgi:hypothetical protein